MKLLSDAAALLDTAEGVYAGDRAAGEILAELRARLDEPLRLAIAGMVKAGKSTLLNAILGEQIAPTDTAECTRVVTWYRYSATPRVTLHPRGGEPRRMPIRRDGGRLVLDLGGLAAEEIEWIDVGWPLAGLEGLILIDTPGIASLAQQTSARTLEFLTSEDSPAAADAVIYLMRHVHSSDVKFLEAFRDTAAGVADTVCAVGVLSRADEIGSGRIDSLLSARQVAARYERENALASLVLGVIPIGGLLAEGARTLRESEFIAFRELARLERLDREALLVSADRFTRDTTVTTQSVSVRRALLERFGMFGVRLATALIRGGATTSSALSEAMVEQSGLLELQEFVDVQFRARATALKARGVVVQLERLVRHRPKPGVAKIRAGIEQIAVQTHMLRELALLAAARAGEISLSEAEMREAQRVIGADGVSATARLGIPADSEPDVVRARIGEHIDRWRRRSEFALSDRATVQVCAVVLRSLDGIASEVGVSGADGTAPDIVLARRPGEGAGEDAHEQREQDQTRLRRKKKLQRFARFTQRDPLR